MVGVRPMATPCAALSVSQMLWNACREKHGECCNLVRLSLWTWLRDVDAAKRKKSLVLGVERLVVGEYEIDQCVTIDEPQIALATGEHARLVGKSAERHEQSELGLSDLA